MAWIEFHQELPRHPKTDMLMDALDISRPTAVGLLGMGWIWAMEFAIEGFIAHNRIGAAARGAGWDGPPAVFAEAMANAGWWDPVDGGYRVHDWEKYIGKLLEKRRQDAERKAASRSTPKDSPKPSKASPKAVRRMSDGQVSDTQEKSEENPRDGSGKPTNLPTNQPSSPAHAHEAPAIPGFEEEDAARLEEVLRRGKVLDPVEFVYGISKAVGLTHGDKAAEAWAAMPSAKRADWLLVAWERMLAAKNIHSRARYVAGVIGSALVDGIDLAAPVDPTPAMPAAEAPPAMDPERVRGVTRKQLLPLLSRAGWERDKALRWCADAPVEELVAKLRELAQEVRNGAA